MTIHLSKFSKKFGREVPACQAHSIFRAPSGDHSSDSTRVDCRRCAKAGGFIPVAKAAPTNVGTCPCCFRVQKLMRTREGGMVHHGYNRPGSGYIVGDCFGVRYERYEDSCLGTKAFRDHLNGIKVELESRLALLLTDEVKSLVFARDIRGGDALTGEQLTKRVYIDVHRGDVERGSRYSRDDTWVPSFEALRQDAIKDLHFDLGSVRQHIVELEIAIRDWRQKTS